MFRASVQGTFHTAPAAGSGAQPPDRPAPGAQVRAFRRLFDNAMTPAPRNLHAALACYVECGRAPNYAALCDMRRAASELRDDLALEGPELCEHFFGVAEAALMVDGNKLAAPQLLLSHLEKTITAYHACDDTLRRDHTPQLYVALTRYLDLLSDRHMAAPPGEHMALGERHEAVRALLFEPQRQRIVRESARRPAQQDKPDIDVLAHLGIGADYEATDQDRAAFRALFESGRILRSNMVYTAPDKCSALYAQYEREVAAVMAQDAAGGSNLHDLIAVRTYTVSSNELNQALRDGDLARIDAFAPYIKTFVSGHRQLRLASSRSGADRQGFITLRRALEMSERQILRAGYVVGAVFRQPTPMSCTGNEHASYLSLRGKYNVQIDVRCKSARRVGEISRHAHSEDESILALHTWFKVTKATWLPGGTRSHPRLDLTIEELDAAPAARHDKA